MHDFFFDCACSLQKFPGQRLSSCHGCKERPEQWQHQIPNTLSHGEILKATVFFFFFFFFSYISWIICKTDTKSEVGGNETRW